MAVLTGTTVVVNPDTGQPVVLNEGDELPAWAADLVGEHLLGEPKKAPPRKAK